jgi:hypothetical protein
VQAFKNIYWNVFNVGVKKEKRINCKQGYLRMGSWKNYADRSTFRTGPERVNKICRVCNI